MSIKLVVRSSKQSSERLERVLAKMSKSAVTPAQPYQTKEVAGTVVIYRTDSTKSSSKQDGAVSSPDLLLSVAAG
jgi:hypothetical protein